MKERGEMYFERAPMSKCEGRRGEETALLYVISVTESVVKIDIG